jgi:hypothetical protein
MSFQSYLGLVVMVKKHERKGRCPKKYVRHVSTYYSHSTGKYVKKKLDVKD